MTKNFLVHIRDNWFIYEKTKGPVNGLVIQKIVRNSDCIWDIDHDCFLWSNDTIKKDMIQLLIFSMGGKENLVKTLPQIPEWCI